MTTELTKQHLSKMERAKLWFSNRKQFLDLSAIDTYLEAPAGTVSNWLDGDQGLAKEFHQTMEHFLGVYFQVPFHMWSEEKEEEKAFDPELKDLTDYLLIKRVYSDYVLMEKWADLPEGTIRKLVYHDEIPTPEHLELIIQAAGYHYGYKIGEGAFKKEEPTTLSNNIQRMRDYLTNSDQEFDFQELEEYAELPEFIISKFAICEVELSTAQYTALHDALAYFYGYE